MENKVELGITLEQFETLKKPGSMIKRGGNFHKSTGGGYHNGNAK